MTSLEGWCSWPLRYISMFSEVRQILSISRVSNPHGSGMHPFGRALVTESNRISI